MNLGAIQNAVYRLVRDSSREFIETPDVREWVNTAQKDLAMRTKLLVKQTAPAAGPTIAVPADFISVVSLVVGTGEVPVAWVDHDEFLKWKNSDSAATPPQGTVARMLPPTTIEVFPTPTDAFSLRYAYLPADLDDDNDEPVFPVVMHQKLVWYAVAMAAIKDGEDGLADYYMSQYERGLPPADEGLGHRIPGPFSLQIEPTVWDIAGTHMGAN